jgi:hypothetical protein
MQPTAGPQGPAFLFLSDFKAENPENPVAGSSAKLLIPVPGTAS